MRWSVSPWTRLVKTSRASGGAPRRPAPVRLVAGLVLVALGCMTATTVNADQSLSPARRASMERSVRAIIGDRIDDPVVHACWEEAESGSDSSLAAVYVLARSWQVMQEISSGTQQIIAEKGASDNSGKALLKLYGDPRLRSARKLIEAYKPAVEFCTGVYNASSNGKGLSIQDFKGQHLGPGVKQYLKLMRSLHSK